MHPTEHALAVTAVALGFVLGIDAGRLRSDTPLADIGADPVAVVAALDLVVRQFGSRLLASQTSGVSAARTVGELSLVIEQFLPRESISVAGIR